MATVTLGGDRLGAGKKEKVYLHEYERSSHDLSYVWRSTMASGTLVPFLTEVGLPGDTFDIDLNTDIMTHPTIGPLFGSYKVQMDVFSVPIRLYQASLHMNMLGIGMKMNTIKLPQLKLRAPQDDRKGDNSQINPSCILSYLNIRGLGRDNRTDKSTPLERDFNAIPLLAYWDIYKNYYANKQEEIGAYIHNQLSVITAEPTVAVISDNEGYNQYPITPGMPAPVQVYFVGDSELGLVFENNVPEDEKEYIAENAELYLGYSPFFVGGWTKINKIFQTAFWAGEQQITFRHPREDDFDVSISNVRIRREDVNNPDKRPQVRTFELENVDTMRKNILQHVGEEAFEISRTTIAPYGSVMNERIESGKVAGIAQQSTQEGLALKTYQSDLFNNWVSTEWIDGENGINDITKISTEEGFITIDEINLSRKIYDMLNRIAVSGGSYDDWLDATYTHERTKSIESPMYMGGLSTELIFQEVVSQAAAEGDPLGTLAGKGTLTQKRKGGKVRIKVDEPSYIMGIVSLTPRVDYSQGNKWDTHLKTMDDFHKPQLDQIGFQDLITEQMAYWDTERTDEGWVQKSAGKQPAWINYMTNVNQVRGNFANDEQMWMTLNRRFEQDENGNIKDLTTYIDPAKFNHIFADARLDAQNFWTQISVNITARRKMSAKVMPNL